jgi:hypothetical protein
VKGTTGASTPYSSRNVFVSNDAIKISVNAFVRGPAAPSISVGSEVQLSMTFRNEKAYSHVKYKHTGDTSFEGHQIALLALDNRQ